MSEHPFKALHRLAPSYGFSYDTVEECFVHSERGKKIPVTADRFGDLEHDFGMTALSVAAEMFLIEMDGVNRTGNFSHKNIPETMFFFAEDLTVLSPDKARLLAEKFGQRV
jgi:hypothetical protein